MRKPIQVAVMTAAGMLILTVGALAVKAPEGTIQYDTETAAVLARGFPEESPAVMDDILAADQKHGWNLVGYDKATDTWTLNASLYIGTDDDLGTFFQIGRKNHPAETVVVKGDVWIRPPRESSKRPDGREAILNRLTLGDPADPGINATLKIVCSKPHEYGVSIGHRTKDAWISRGSLHVHNSTLTAAAPEYKLGYGPGGGWYGSDIRLNNAVIAHLSGTYGMNSGNAVIDGSVFEHMGMVVQNGHQEARNSVFRNCDAALLEGGCLSARMIKCVFSNNQHNFTLGSGMSGDIVLIDCEVHPQTQPVQLRKNKMSPAEAIQRRRALYPSYSELVSLVVEVTDERGRPLPDVWVDVSCAEHSTAVANGLALTDADGQTPSDPEAGAILITRRKMQATDDPEQPREFTFTYNIKALAEGRRTQEIRVAHDEPLPRPYVIAITSKRRTFGCARW